jgi:malonyl CoA-acyl carrier protein transacylase
MRTLVLFPGRGSYAKDDLGSLKDLHSPSVDTLEGVRREAGRPGPREMDAAERFSGRTHVAGEHASILTAAVSLGDLDQLDRERVEVVAVCGNSMGWYTALGYAGALPLGQAGRLIDTLGAYQAEGIIGGQIVYPMMDAQWRLDPAKLAAVEAAIADIEDLHWSIHLGHQAVLGGSEEALAAATKRLPKIDQGARSFPLRLPLHAAFHTPLMAQVAERAFGDLHGLDWRAPSLPLIDGRGAHHRPFSANPADIMDYTLGEQITEPFDFTTMLTSALGAYGPDAVILPGPGSNLGGAVAQAMISVGWAGIHSKEDFLEAQKASPVLFSMRWPEQRAQVVAG